MFNFTQLIEKLWKLKESKSKLRNQRGMFIQIGLVIAISTSLIAFEWKSYEKSASDLGTMELALEDEEMIPITQREIKLHPHPHLHRDNPNC